MAAVKLHDDVGGSLIGIGPSFLLHRNQFALAVLGIESTFAGNQTHPAVVETLVGDIAIVNGEALVLHPSIGVLGEAMTHGADAQSMQIAVLILPTLLQQQCALAHILARNHLFLAETSLTHAVGIAGVVILIV